MSQTTSLKTIIFDMGNVLVYFSHEKMFQQIGALCGKTEQEIREQLIESGLQWEFERGRIDATGLKGRLEGIFDCQLDLDAFCLATADIFKLNTSILPVLDELKRRGLRLVLLSNTCCTHIDFIHREFDVLKRFDHLVVSHEVGSVKPEAPIYAAAIAAAQCAPHEALYTDDIVAYAEAGRSHGLNAVVFTDTEKYVNDLAKFGIDLQST